jgi:hypothetical protein
MMVVLRDIVVVICSIDDAAVPTCFFLVFFGVLCLCG